MPNETRQTYEDVVSAFKWSLPERFNMAHQVCDKHCGKGRLALIDVGRDGLETRYSFDDVRDKANRFANFLLQLGAKQGDRVFIFLGQELYTPVCHIGCWKAGLISVPSATVFGDQAVAYRLNDSGARFAVTNKENYPKLLAAQLEAPGLERIIVVDGPVSGAIDLPAMLPEMSGEFVNVDLLGEEPGYISYTSGTTGLPKGALHAHRGMLGLMPAWQMSFDYPDRDRDVMWAPVDWAWIAGLMNNLMGAWCFGIPVVASRLTKFDPKAAYETLEKYGVTLSILMPTVLKMMRSMPKGERAYNLRLRVVLTGSETVGAELLRWVNAELSPLVIESYGQTENNLAVICNPETMGGAKIGALGKATSGQEVAIVDNDGHPVPDRQVGNIAYKAGGPIQLLEYWRKPEATKKLYANGWMISGDLGYRDEDGFLWFQGRTDDVITSSGYKIGPGEIENALLSHPSVSISAVIGVPHPIKTEEIKAFIVLKEGMQPSEALKTEISNYVAERLARHERPRIIEFVNALPLNTNGKVQRSELRKLEKEAAATASP